MFDLQYFDIHDTDVNELYQFVNSGLTDCGMINNVKDLAGFILPNVQLNAMNVNKLNSFLYSLNLAVYDLKMLRELVELHGKYEAFNCYKRVIIKFAIDIIELCNKTDYLSYELFSKAPTPPINDESAQPPFMKSLMEQIAADDKAYAKIFF